MGVETPRLREFSKVLVVEDDEVFRPQIVALLKEILPAAEIHDVGTAEAARQELDAWRPELLVLDYELPDEKTAYHVLGAARGIAGYQPVALVISEDKPGIGDAFGLPAAGARAYVSKMSKPFTPDNLREHIEICRQPPDLGQMLRKVVGSFSFKQAADMTRYVMMEEALAREDDTQSAAARLLEMSRKLFNYHYPSLLRWKRRTEIPPKTSPSPKIPPKK